MTDSIDEAVALLRRSAALHRAMILDLPGLLEDAGLSDEEHLCQEAEALADEIDAAIASLSTPPRDEEPTEATALRILVILGACRDHMSAESVKAFQALADELRSASSGGEK